MTSEMIDEFDRMRIKFRANLISNTLFGKYIKTVQFYYNFNENHIYFQLVANCKGEIIVHTHIVDANKFNSIDELVDIIVTEFLSNEFFMV